MFSQRFCSHLKQARRLLFGLSLTSLLLLPAIGQVGPGGGFGGNGDDFGGDPQFGGGGGGRGGGGGGRRGGRGGGGGRRGGGGGGGGYDGRYGVPVWQVEPEFRRDVFVFARLMYNSGNRPGPDDGLGAIPNPSGQPNEPSSQSQGFSFDRGFRDDFFGGGGGRNGGRWATDFPQADLNLSFRLQQMTSMKIHPHERPVTIDARELAHFPFVYMLEVGGLRFTDREATTMRNYLLGGGFLMVDDFWGEDAWENFAAQMQRVFPDRPIVDLPLDHTIFNCVFTLKQYPQMPAIGIYEQTGLTWEPRHYYGPNNDTAPHFRAIFDDKGRIMVMICHNTDLGDGWEREGESIEYFKTFAEPLAYPMAINILFYAMTH